VVHFHIALLMASPRPRPSPGAALLKRVEDSLEVLRSMPTPLSMISIPSLGLWFEVRIVTAPCPGREFRGVLQQVPEHLLQAGASARTK